ncbi:lectin-like [Hevea brasiliensis]|uniref:lectin-like n=1 Tax=Hevea brasiliensis TaxID=3981 RepID=UPI0025D8EC4D|nr:lectin-like [Hevea brasiliensis]
MVASSHLFRRHQFFSSIIGTLLLTTAPFTHQTSIEDTSFSFNEFNPENKLDIKLEGDAYTSSSIIELTKDMEVLSSNASVGRATCGRPMHLWDKASGNLADFATHFSFVIYSHNSNRKGSGFAFFLAA